MSLESSNNVLTVKQINAMVKNGTINLNHEIQRGIRWNNAERSYLIDSIVQGYPTGQLFARKMDTEAKALYYIMDGKQRITAVVTFVNGEFRISGIDVLTFRNPMTGEFQTEVVRGKKFDELSEELQDIILSATFNIVYFHNLSDNEARELFKRINSGKALTGKEKLLATSENAAELILIGSHALFNKILTKRAIDNKNYVSYLCKAWCMLNMDIKDVSFDAKSMSKFVQELKMTDDQTAEIISVYDYLDEVVTILKNNNSKAILAMISKETHFASIIPYVSIAQKNDIGIEDFILWLENFFCSGKNEVYFMASNSGSAKNANIFIRDEELKKSFSATFKIGG